MVKHLSRRVVVGVVGVLMLVLSIAGATSVGAQSTTTQTNTYGCAVNDYRCFYYVGSNGMYPYVNNTTYNAAYLYGYNSGYGYGYPGYGYATNNYAYTPAVNYGSTAYGYGYSGYPANTVVSTYFDPRYCGNGAVSVVTDAGGALIDICTSTGQRIIPVYPDYGYGYGYGYGGYAPSGYGYYRP